MKNLQLFLTNLILSGVRFAILLPLALVFVIIGAFGIRICLYIGWGILALYVMLSLIFAIQSFRLVNYRTFDDPEFNEMMDRLQEDPKAFLSNIMENQEERKSMHGEELLALDDDELWETIWLQNLDIAETAEDENTELQAFSGPRRVVYILSTFDAEIQNGGLCQFFVNSSREVAPFVCESLSVVGATEHCALLQAFVTENGIDLSDLSSFMVTSRRGYIKQTKRFDFDSFDQRYYELPPLQECATAYIRANIEAF